MFKTGIHKLEQLKNPKALKTIFGNEKNISITLYNEAITNNYDNQIVERILLNFVDARGAFKRTYSNRFGEFDKFALSKIKQYFPKKTSLTIHDAAVSDGRTACDFFHLVNKFYINLKYYASDYDPYIYIVREGKLKVAFSKEGVPLEVVYPPMVLNMIKNSLKYPINTLIAYILKKTFVKSICEKFKNNFIESQCFSLVSPEATLLANNNHKFVLKKYNLLEKNDLFKNLNIVRAMNILNIDYFSHEEFRLIINNIFNSLSEEGLFIMGSNQDSTSIVNGAIFMKCSNCFIKIFSSGSNTFAENIILSYKV